MSRNGPKAGVPGAGSGRGVGGADRDGWPVRGRIDALPVVAVAGGSDHDSAPRSRVVDRGEQRARAWQDVAHVDDASAVVGGPANGCARTPAQQGVRRAEALLPDELDSEQRAARADRRDDARNGRAVADLVHRIVVAVAEVDAVDHPPEEIRMRVVDPGVDDRDARRGIASSDLPRLFGVNQRQGRIQRPSRSGGQRSRGRGAARGQCAGTDAAGQSQDCAR